MSFIDQIAIVIHTVTAILWVGGMFLVFRVLRPAAMILEPPIRLTLFLNVFNRFFPWVWVFIFALLLTGYWDWSARFGGLETTPIYIQAMHIIGWIMILLFAWLYFVPFAHFKQYIANQDFPSAGKTMNDKVRPIIAINLFLGLVEAVIGSAGPYWFI